MERRTVFLASMGALSVVACGGEPEEAYGEVQQAATSITPALLIKSISVTGVTPGFDMKLTVAVLAPLYLGTIVLVKGTSGVKTTGKLAIGAPRRPSMAEATINAELWDRILEDSATYTLTIELDYNSDRTINNIYIGYV